MSCGEISLELENWFLNQMLTAAPVFIARVGRDYKIEFYNFSVADGIILRPEEVIGRHVKDLHWWSNDRQVAATVILGIKTAFDGIANDIEVPNQHADGRNAVSRLYFVPLMGDDGSVISVSCTGIDITEEVEDREYRAMLLREVHHRVKNSLQLVSSILSLEASASKTERSREGFLRAAARIIAVSKVHQLIFQIDSFEQVPLQPYIRDLCEGLERSVDQQRQRIRIQAECAEVALVANRAISLALIVNELITNSLKYAFVDRHEGLVLVNVRRSGDQMVLSVTDNGRGVSPEMPDRHPELTHLGERMIEVLARQMDGQIIKQSTTEGYAVSVTFVP